MRVVAIMCMFSGALFGREDQKGAARDQGAALTDSALTTLMGPTDLATIYMRNGAQLRARIVSVTASVVVVELCLAKSIVDLDRVDIVRIERYPLRPPPTATVAPLAAADRHFGLLGSLPTGGVMLDLDYRLFYMFGNVALVLPAASSGRLVSAGIGAGVALPLRKRSAWKLELFGFFAPYRAELDNLEDYPSEKAWHFGLGVGVGIHYTSATGLTLAFKIPIVGFATGFGSAAQGVSNFDGAALLGLPIASIGFRR